MFARGRIVWPCLLDGLFPGVVGAFGMRRLKATYNGYVARIIRSSDLSSTDVGFDSQGNLSLSSPAVGGPKLSNWLGVNDGYLSTWYDQSGNGNNAINGVWTGCPQIAVAGVLNTINGRVTAHFDGTRTLNITDNASIDLNTALSLYAVVSFDNFTSVRAIIDKRTNNTQFQGYHAYVANNSQINLQWNDTTNNIASKAVTPMSTGSLYSLSWFATKDVSCDFWQRLIDQGSSALTGSGSSIVTDPLRIGGHVSSPSLQLVGNLSELILVNSVHSLAQKNFILNNQVNWFAL